MHWLGWLMFGVVALWLVPGSLWRPVALALLVGWYVPEVMFAFTNDYLPLSIYVAADIAVIAAVLLFRSHWSDWLILAPYPVVWWFYTLPETRGQWLALYWIAFVQFIVAGPWPQLQRIGGNVSHGSVKWAAGPRRTPDGGT